jgi:hypothetical protein
MGLQGIGLQWARITQRVQVGQWSASLLLILHHYMRVRSL